MPILTRKANSYQEIIDIHNKVPEFSQLDLKIISDRIEGKSVYSQVAVINGETAGYLLGYWIDSDHFYYWLGAVLPTFRKQGAALSLLKEMESYVQANHGSLVSVKSMNRFPPMLIMLIKNGYHITGFDKKNEPGLEKILFTKKLI